MSEARSFLTELEETAEICDSTAMRAEAADRRGTLALMDGQEDVAILESQAAIKGWTGLRMPYETAQSRLRLGSAFEKAGNDAAALMEMESAAATLERLGVASV